ncbi:uncharacterized protein YkwD [Bradyrhizobium embrapense]
MEFAVNPGCNSPICLVNVMKPSYTMLGAISLDDGGRS